MPLYVYACESGGHGFEARQSFNDAPLTTCPECGGKIRRVIQPVGIVFKGSGFYKNDSRKSSETSVPTAERKADAAPAASSDGSSTPATPAAPSNGSTPAAGGNSTPAASSGGETKASTPTTAS
ncbi:MAG: FmdB family transcriptional regulator [Chloroflexi bacterium]|jgi:putative FmdB family regulatory protein|nr:FmdB family transcriptional regulator [Chloroflexota bacterium]